jgi:hypothetical protein
MNGQKEQEEQPISNFQLLKGQDWVETGKDFGGLPYLKKNGRTIIFDVNKDRVHPSYTV